jgi:hypothetical protein
MSPDCCGLTDRKPLWSPYRIAGIDAGYRIDMSPQSGRHGERKLSDHDARCDRARDTSILVPPRRVLHAPPPALRACTLTLAAAEGKNVYAGSLTARHPRHATSFRGPSSEKIANAYEGVFDAGELASAPRIIDADDAMSIWSTP